MSQRLLLVEDEATTVLFVKKRLERVGYIVRIAGNGQEGLRIVRSENIDIIVTDVVMPVMDGVDFYEELKKSPDTCNIPVIIITDSDMFRKSFGKLGVENFVEKPLDGDELLVKLEEIQRERNSEKKKMKAIVLGSDEETNEMIKELLIAKGFFVQVCGNDEEFMSDCLTMKPDLIFVDVLLSKIPAKELVKALKCFSLLLSSKIFTYTCLDPEQMSDVDAVESLKESIHVCNEHGVTKYIGRFAKTTFIESISEYLLKE